MVVLHGSFSEEWTEWACIESVRQEIVGKSVDKLQCCPVGDSVSQVKPQVSVQCCCLRALTGV